MNLTRGDGPYNKLRQNLVMPNLLLLYDFGMKQTNLGMTQGFLSVIEEKYHIHMSVSILGHLPVKN